MKSRLDLAVSDLGSTQLKNIAEPVHVYSVEIGKPARAQPIKTVARKQRRLFALGAGIVALIIIAASVWYFFGVNRPTTIVASLGPNTRGLWSSTASAVSLWPKVAFRPSNTSPPPLAWSSAFARPLYISASPFCA